MYIVHMHIQINTPVRALILLRPLLQNRHRILQLPNPLPNPHPHLLPNLGINIRRIIVRRRSRHPTIIRLRLLRLMRLGRGADLGSCIEGVCGEELVQRIAGGFPV